MNSSSPPAAPAMAFRGIVLGTLMVILVIMASSCQGCEGSGCHDDERRALLEIHQAFNFPDWGNSIAEEGKDCCRWSGINCEPDTGRLVGIHLLDEKQSAVGEIWRPNLTMLVAFRRLESLNLGFDFMDIPQGNFPQS